MSSFAHPMPSDQFTSVMPTATPSSTEQPTPSATPTPTATPPSDTPPATDDVAELLANLGLDEGDGDAQSAVTKVLVLLDFNGTLVRYRQTFQSLALSVAADNHTAKKMRRFTVTRPTTTRPNVCVVCAPTSLFATAPSGSVR